MLKSILVLENDHDVIKYKQKYADYLNEELLVISQNAFFELSDSYMSRCVTIGERVFTVADKAKGIYIYDYFTRHGKSYSKYFAFAYCDNESDYFDILENEAMPVQFAFDYDIEVYNGDRYVQLNNYDSFSFSNSCGWYDNDTHVVINYELYNIVDTTTLENGDVVRSEDGFYCDNCYSTVHINCTEYNDHIDDRVCDSCNENINEQYSNDYSIHRMGYHTNVLNYCNFGDAHLKINDKPIFSGFELETCAKYTSDFEDINDSIKTCYESSNAYAIPTEDGSLCDDFGVEFVFRPDNSEGHRKALERFFENIAPHFHKTDDGYGLHVHISNHFLNDFDKIKIQNFVANNEDFFRKIGGREETSYQSVKKINKTADLKEKQHGKYSAVNISPRETIEFRYPAGIVNKLHILANIELALATCLFCKYKSNAINAKKSAFVDYIKGDEKYNNLVKYMMINHMFI